MRNNTKFFQIAIFAMLSLSWAPLKAATLIEKAEKELVLAPQNESSSEQSFLQTEWPEDTRAEGRSAWSIEIGLENQKPQGRLELSGLDDMNLSRLDSKTALYAGLSWWFGENLNSLWGNNLRAALSLQMAWSQHRYQLQTPGSSESVEARLHLLRPQLALNMEYLAIHAPKWDTEFWVGLSLGRGRFIQSQSTFESSLLNATLTQNYWEYGPQIRTLIAETFLVSLQYRQRVYSQALQEKTHHALFSVGIAL
jgi:hypothetical protein